MKKLDTQSPDFQAELKALLAFETAQNPEIDRIVADICADVQKRGDAALIEYTNRFDGTSAQTIDDLILTQDDLQSAFERLPENIQTAPPPCRYRLRRTRGVWRRRRKRCLGR